MSIFTISVICIAALLLIIGIVLLKKNIKPILGFFMLVFALVLFIGMSMSADDIERSVTNFVSRIIK